MQAGPSSRNIDFLVLPRVSFFVPSCALLWFLGCIVLACLAAEHGGDVPTSIAEYLVEESVLETAAERGGGGEAKYMYYVEEEKENDFALCSERGDRG